MPNYPATQAENQLYFITTKAVDYKQYFEPDSVKRILLDTLDFYRLSSRWQLFAFAIMPNHIHWIAKPSPGYSISALIRDFKSHTADRIMRHWTAVRNTAVLDSIRVKSPAGKERYQIWEHGYLAKIILSAEILKQKMDYIHFNPCRSHWNLSPDPVSYSWSSARFYLSTEKCIIPVDDINNL